MLEIFDAKFLPDVRRVEVIDESGRTFARMYDPGFEVMVSVQDNGRTLKIIVVERGELSEIYEN